jgi:thiol-disulfide isomerase/thioredoxin
MARKLTLIGCALIALATSAHGVEAGDRAPRFQAAQFSGEIVAFPEATAGHPAVLVFWATWCNYCKAFMPFLKNIEADYRDRGVRIVTVNAKEDGNGDPDAYIRNLGFPMVAVRNGNAIARAYGVEYIPGLMIVDGNGSVSYRRPWTDLPAGREVAELWDGQVRTELDALLAH